MRSVVAGLEPSPTTSIRSWPATLSEAVEGWQ
jgi:hypothetical protein